MKHPIGKNAALLVVAITSAIALAACDVDQTREAEAPDVDVEGGQVPAYDVETADVDVETRTEEIEVPEVDVQMPAEDDKPQQDPQDPPDR